MLGTPALRARLHEQDDATSAVIAPPTARQPGRPEDDVQAQVLPAAITATLHVGIVRWAAEGGDITASLTGALRALRDAVCG